MRLIYGVLGFSAQGSPRGWPPRVTDRDLAGANWTTAPLDAHSDGPPCEHRTLADELEQAAIHGRRMPSL